MLRRIVIPILTLPLLIATIIMSQNQADSIIYDNEVENAIDHDPIDIEAAHQRYRDDRILPPSTIQDSDTVQGERFFKHQKRGEVCVVQVKRSCWKQWVNDLDKVIHVKWIHKNDYLLEAQRQRSMKGKDNYTL